jgi:transcriptional regulator with XRE-family HTH domain
MAKAKHSAAYDQFCALLVAARTSAGLKQVDVAKRLGLPQSYVSKVEQGERRLDVVEFIEFSRAIDADPLNLLRQIIGFDGCQHS